MAAGNYDITIEQGATFKITLTIKDELGVVIDLTGLTFRGKIKKSFADTDAQANFDFNVLDQTDPLTKGMVEVILPADQTEAIPAPAKGNMRTLTKMVYDIESENIGGDVVRWLQGSALISPEVTT